jgi:hypothetical protein
VRPELRDADAAHRAALQRTLLLQPAVRHDASRSRAEVRRVVEAAVRTFLHGNAAG